MIKKVWKQWWAWDFDKEEAWYNEMAAKGYNLSYIRPFQYYFQTGTPGEYIYRQELLDHLPSHPESESYIQFMEETGVELVCTYQRWAIFRRKAEDGAFDLFSDLDSRLKHLKRVGALLLSLTLMEFAIGLNNISLSFAADSPLNFWCGLICLLLGICLLSGSRRVWKMSRKIAKERNIRE